MVASNVIRLAVTGEPVQIVGRCERFARSQEVHIVSLDPNKIEEAQRRGWPSASVVNGKDLVGSWREQATSAPLILCEQDGSCGPWPRTVPLSQFESNPNYWCGLPEPPHQPDPWVPVRLRTRYGVD